MTDHAATPTRHWIIVTWDDQSKGGRNAARTAERFSHDLTFLT